MMRNNAALPARREFQIGLMPAPLPVSGEAAAPDAVAVAIPEGPALRVAAWALDLAVAVQAAAVQASASVLPRMSHSYLAPLTILAQ